MKFRVTNKINSDFVFHTDRPAKHSQPAITSHVENINFLCIYSLAAISKTIISQE